jgi:hypothetical protein
MFGIDLPYWRCLRLTRWLIDILSIIPCLVNLPQKVPAELFDDTSQRTGILKLANAIGSGLRRLTKLSDISNEYERCDHRIGPGTAEEVRLMERSRSRSRNLSCMYFSLRLQAKFSNVACTIGSEKFSPLQISTPPTLKAYNFTTNK